MWYGTEQPTMEDYRAFDPTKPPPSRRSRKIMEGQSRGLQWNSVDLTNRRMVARPTRTVPAIPNLPSPLPTVGPTGSFEEILCVLTEDLKHRGKLNLSEAFLDGTFAAAPKGGLALGRPSAEKVVKS